MARISHRGEYSARAWLLALFVTFALALGGGGTPNPTTEVILEFVFVVFALAWIWLPGRGAPAGAPSPDRLTFVLVAIPLVIPVVQLIPLPPWIWTALPGRENELAALSLVGQQGAWHPISLSPSRTLASLLAIVPGAFCLYAMSHLVLHERRLVLAAILFMAILTSLIGAIQLTAGGQGISLYAQHHVGWVTGFQANRNATADVLLIGLLSLAVLSAPYLVGGRQRPPLRLNHRAWASLTAGIALFLLAATIMTGSRTGTALVMVAAIAAVLIFALGRDVTRFSSRVWPLALTLLVVMAGLGLTFLVLADVTAASRVAIRFADIETTRAEIWEDTRFALKQYWPVGFGVGGFEPAMLPAERLEVLTPAVPNRAHNDFLELGLEAGLFGYTMLAAAIILCITISWRAWREVPGMRRQIIFGLGVLLVIAFHSVVDYPLRSMAVASLAGVAAGTLVRIRASTNQPSAVEAPTVAKGLA